MPGSGQGYVESWCESRSVAVVEVMQQREHPLAKLARSHDRVAATRGRHRIAASRNDPTLADRTSGREKRRRRFQRRVADEVSTAPGAPAERGIARQPRLGPTTNGAPLPQAATVGRTTHHRRERPNKGVPADTASAAHLPIAFRAPSANHGQKSRLREHAMPGTHGETGEIRLKGQWLQGRSEGAGPSSASVHPSPATSRERVVSGNDLENRGQDGRCHDVGRNDVGRSQAHEEARQTLDHRRPEPDASEGEQRSGAPDAHADRCKPTGPGRAFAAPGQEAWKTETSEPASSKTTKASCPPPGEPRRCTVTRRRTRETPRFRHRSPADARERLRCREDARRWRRAPGRARTTTQR